MKATNTMCDFHDYTDMIFVYPIFFPHFSLMNRYPELALRQVCLGAKKLSKIDLVH